MFLHSYDSAQSVPGIGVSLVLGDIRKRGDLISDKNNNNKNKTKYKHKDGGRRSVRKLFVHHLVHHLGKVLTLFMTTW